MGAGRAGLLQLGDPGLCHLLESDDSAEVNGLGRAGLGARGLEAHLHPVVAERALLGCARYRVDADHPERARADTVSAPVTHVRLDHDRVELGSDNGARRAHLEAAGPDAMLADVAHHQPSPLAAVGADLLDELHMPPVDAVELASVVIAVPGRRAVAAVRRREVIALLARHLTS